MKIKSFHLAPCVMGNAGAEWKTAIGTRAGREAWLISFEADNGAVGYGYAPATTHLGSTWRGVEADLNLLAPLVIGRDAFDIEPILTALDHRLTGAQAAKAGIDYRLGAAVGSRLLAAQSLHLAVGLPNLTFACELGEFDRLTNDPFSGIEIVNGTLTLPGGIGSGLTYTDLK